MTAISTDLSRHTTALLPDFELVREIGRGGMGIVYVAMDVKLDRAVAIKVLPEQLAMSSLVRQRFLREARTSAKLSHPNIVPIYRADENAGVAFFVMGYVDGPSLAERLSERGPLAAVDAIPLLRDVANALDYAHSRGVVHRDVKPENILIERDVDRALVTDFGIARLAEAAPLTGTGQVLGTVHYMSPEQASGDTLDGRSDLYSLGVVAFRVLTGRLPFDHEHAAAVIVAHVTKAPPRVRDIAPAVPLAIAMVVDTCLRKDPAARYQTGGALAAALDDAAREMARDPAASVAAPPVVTEREAQALWARAAQLQAETGLQDAVRSPVAKLPPPTSGESRSLTSGYRLDDVRSAAEEAGIPERYVQRAAAELGIGAAAAGLAPIAPGVPARVVSADMVVDEAPPPNVLAGSPMSIVFELVIPREARSDDFEVLVAIIRKEMGDPGNISTLGRSLVWSAQGSQRKIVVSVVPRDGNTTIRVDERLGPLAGALFGGIVGGAGGGSAGLAMGIGASAFHSVVIGMGLWGVGILTSYVAARTFFRRTREKRASKLRAMVETMAEHVMQSATALPPGRRNS